MQTTEYCWFLQIRLSFNIIIKNSGNIDVLQYFFLRQYFTLRGKSDVIELVNRRLDIPFTFKQAVLVVTQYLLYAFGVGNRPPQWLCELNFVQMQGAPIQAWICKFTRIHCSYSAHYYVNYTYLNMWKRSVLYCLKTDAITRIKVQLMLYIEMNILWHMCEQIEHNLNFN